MKLVGCRSCAERRKRLAEQQAAKKAKGQKVQAAAIGAAIALSDTVNQIINGEVDSGKDTGSDSEGSSGTSG